MRLKYMPDDMEQKTPFTIGIPVYNDVDLLDVTGPYEIFSLINTCGALEVKVYILAEENEPIYTRNHLQLIPHKTFDEVQYLDLLWVPGGDPKALNEKMKDKKFLDHLTVWSKTAKYVTSVCEGALILASAGLLDGYCATTHWAFIPCLREFTKIKVADGYPRFITDSKNDESAIRVTGGGISSGLDEALELVRLICGEEVAEKIQLFTQYFPHPPIQANLEQHVEELKKNEMYNCPLDCTAVNV